MSISLPGFCARSPVRVWTRTDRLSRPRLEIGVAQPACRLDSWELARRLNPDRLSPKAVLYVHLSDEALQAGRGVARVEDIGPVTVQHVRDLLRHRNVRVTPVLDVAQQRPVDGYEVPARMAEAIRLATGRDAFPYAAGGSRHTDLDHVTPYLAPDHGGPPGQTRPTNAAPLNRFHHRIKTFSRWSLRQLAIGVHLWHSPHGYYWLVDHTGTHGLPRTAGDAIWHAVTVTADAS